VSTFKVGDRVFVASPHWGSVIGIVTKVIYADQAYLIVQSEETGKLYGVPANVCEHAPHSDQEDPITE